MLIAPTSIHRLSFREGDKEWLLLHSNRLAIAGLALLAGAIALAVFVALSVVLESTWAGLIAALTALWFAWFWYGRPLLRKR